MGKWQSKCTGYIDVTSVKQLLSKCDLFIYGLGSV